LVLVEQQTLTEQIPYLAPSLQQVVAKAAKAILLALGLAVPEVVVHRRNRVLMAIPRQLLRRKATMAVWAKA
jgi:hypothetical protein